MKKVIGLVMMLLIVYIAFKSLVFLPSLTNLIIGPNKSPFQIGTDYVEQMNAVYPYNGQNTVQNKNIVLQNSQTKTKIVGKITLEKLNGNLILTVESANPGRDDLSIWLTDTSEVTNDTNFVDFGKLLKSSSIRQYFVDMKGSDLSFERYKNILIVDSNYQVYARILLK